MVINIFIFLLAYFVAIVTITFLGFFLFYNSAVKELKKDLEKDLEINKNIIKDEK